MTGSEIDNITLAFTFQPKAPVVTRACYLLECAYYVHQCNRGQKPDTFIYLQRLHHCTEVHFANFLSGGFIIMAVIDPPEKKMAKRSFVHCLVLKAYLKENEISAFLAILVFLIF